MMSHACLMKSAAKTLLRNDHLVAEENPAVRAARHARQMQDINHAMEIYLRVPSLWNLAFSCAFGPVRGK